MTKPEIKIDELKQLVNMYDDTKVIAEAREKLVAKKTPLSAMLYVLENEGYDLLSTELYDNVMDYLYSLNKSLVRNIDKFPIIVGE